jgi:leucyl-tRNA synthetase
MAADEDRYQPREVEERWRNKWQEANTFKAVRRRGHEKVFLLEMFPYPSGRLHMGHVRNYTIGDVLARFRRMKGADVLYPMGWDAFGLPAENAAIKAGVHPRKWTLQNIEHMRAQFTRLGLSYDWSREVTTCEPEYFVHEQRIFIEMYKRGLAYRKAAVVNWCPFDKTVLANEQVEDGKCWRCGTVVVERELEQWFLKVTAYADELLGDAQKILKGHWPDKILTMQENWIGRSEGARISFGLDGGTIDVFTTRPDTLFGVTFMSIAAEHPLVARATAEAKAFAEQIKKEDKISRTAEGQEKHGIASGLHAIHPFTGEKVPIYVANFVLMDYGTGAVMAVPAHDERDFAFATKYGLSKKTVISPPDGWEWKNAYTGDGKMVDSGDFTGLDNEAGKKAVTDALVKMGKGSPTVSYRLRDWLLSRQRYWGCPIPMIKCETDGWQAVPDEQLPLTLPDDVTLAEGGRSPLATHPTWSKTTCPKCGGPATRETDTMDGFMESSWYPLRYASPDNGPDGKWLNREEVDAWMPADQYIGGAEHATKHLIYARFFTKMLRDWGWIRKDIDEPFLALLNQGMVCKETYRCPEHDYLYPEEVTDGKCKQCGKVVVVGRSEKMSKSLKNVVEPLPLMDRYGADTVRLFSLFAAPVDSMLEWNDAGVEGMWRFLGRVWRLANQILAHQRPAGTDGEAELRQKTHQTLKKVTEDFERFSFNTSIAAIMELVNATYQTPSLSSSPTGAVWEALEQIVRLLAPFAPHITEEIWSKMGKPFLLATNPWPAYDATIAAKKRVQFPVQVNGKLRGQVEAEPDATEAQIRAVADTLAPVQAALTGKTIVKVVFVPGRLLNIVVK